MDATAILAEVGGSFASQFARGRYPGLPTASRMEQILDWVPGGGPLSDAFLSGTRRQAAKAYERQAFRRARGAFTQPISRWGARGVFGARGAFASAARAMGPNAGMIMLGAGGAAVANLATAAFVVPLALEAGSAVAGAAMELGRDYSRPDFGSPFFDTQQAFTQRQAALAAIHNSQLQTRSFFGREAQAFHG